MAKKSPASVLKAKGLIPSSWDLRSLSRGQKSWITKQTRTFSEVIKKPREFSTVSAKTATHKKQAKAAGLPVTNKRAVVRTGGGKVKRQGDKLVIVNPERKLEVWFANSKNFLKAVERARKRKLKPNQVWGFHIGSRVNNVQHRSFEKLMQYLADKDDWHSPNATDYVSLVLITENRRHVVAHNTYDEDDQDEE